MLIPKIITDNKNRHQQTHERKKLGMTFAVQYDENTLCVKCSLIEIASCHQQTIPIYSTLAISIPRPYTYFFLQKCGSGSVFMGCGRYLFCI